MLLLTSTDVDTYDLTIDPQQTLAVVATPVTSGMTVTVTLISPTGKVIGTATSTDRRVHRPSCPESRAPRGAPTRS